MNFKKMRTIILNLRKVVVIVICLTAITVFSGCNKDNKDEMSVKFDEKTFIEQKKLW